MSQFISVVRNRTKRNLINYDYSSNLLKIDKIERKIYKLMIYLITIYIAEISSII